MLSEVLSGCSCLIAAVIVQSRRKIRRARQQRNTQDKNQPRQRVVVATAAIPWMTGTAVNPCLRAAFLAKDDSCKVLLVVPWLQQHHQARTFPDGLLFDRPEQQTECIRSWVQKRAGFDPQFEVVYFAARYDDYILGILPVGDVTEVIPPGNTELVVLEEPEHLTWHHHGNQWREQFPCVVGVMHTNYTELAIRTGGFGVGYLMCGLMHTINWCLCGMHCHRNIKLSGAVQRLPREVVENVHGVAPRFLDMPEEGRRNFSRGAYSLGKVVWGKGWEQLLHLLAKHAATHPESTCPLDAYGEGEALASVQKLGRKLRLQVHWGSRRDHLDPSLRDYKIFINASTSDVVATTSLEALAMGKWLLCADHPCNHFAARFHNCLLHRTAEDFAANLAHAQANDPKPLSDHELRELGWDAATERLLAASRLAASPPRCSRSMSAAYNWLYGVWNAVTGIELVRIFICAGAGTRDTPDRPTHWVQRPNPLLGPARLMHSRLMRASFYLTISPAFGCGIQFR